MGSDQQFCLRWHNYQSSLLAALPQLLDSDDLTDVTLSAGGHNIKAHRVVLSACSQYFKELFKVLQPMQHPVIVLPGTNFTDLCALVTFMYSGEVNIYQEQLQGLLTMADAMQIKGLAEVNGSSNNEAAVQSEPSYSATKRPKLSAQAASSLGVNSTVTENNRNFPKPLQTEAVDSVTNAMKIKEFEMYGNGSRHAVSCKKTLSDSDPQYSGLSRIETVKLENIDSMDPYTGSVRSTRCSNAVSPPETDVPHAEETSCSSPKPTLTGSSVNMEDSNVKVEVDNTQRIASNEGNTAIRKCSTLDGIQVSSADNEMSVDHSPSSDDSGGGSYGIEAMADRIQLSQGLHLPSFKLNSYPSQYNKLLANCTSPSSSKLFVTCFVCGKQLSNPYNLRVHMETHQNVNYACSVCSHVSRSRDALRKHVSYRHPVEGRERTGIGGNSREGRQSNSNAVSGVTRKHKINTTDDVKRQQP